jgi:hypothetical protein
MFTLAPPRGSVVKVGLEAEALRIESCDVGRVVDPENEPQRPPVFVGEIAAVAIRKGVGDAQRQGIRRWKPGASVAQTGEFALEIGSAHEVPALVHRHGVGGHDRR